MVDHLQSRVTPWRQYASHVKVLRHFIENGCKHPAISQLTDKSSEAFHPYISWDHEELHNLHKF